MKDAKVCPRGAKKIGNRCVSKSHLVDIHIYGLSPDMAVEVEHDLSSWSLEWTRKDRFQ